MSQEDGLFRILVASDIHLGYGEKDKIRGNDSFTTFEEVLQLGKKNNVDFVLLGGDLFHDNKPTQTCMQKCTELLRKYCFGDGDIKYKLISDQQENFRHTDLFPFVNYEDSNLNISMPVFTIHGNHDDPVGKAPHCYLEVLSAAGLVNYFGKYMDMNGIELHPLLFKKEKTKLAMYGLGSLPEERLHRFFKDDKIKFFQPTEHPEKWFNLFVVHQNRAAHTETKFLPEKFLTNLPNLVIWGHEHEAISEPDYSNEMDYFIYQPGSTVITSLCEGESKPKQVGLLQIVFDKGDKENKFNLTPIPLETGRQLMFASKDLDEIFPLRKDRENSEKVRKWCVRVIEDMIKTAKEEHSGNELQPTLPLVRLRVDSSSGLPFSLFLLKTHFEGKVANPHDIVLFKLKKLIRSENVTEMDSQKLESLASQNEAKVVSNIEEIVKEYFEAAEEKAQLRMMDEKAATLSVKEMVDKESIDSLPELVEYVLNDCREFLINDASLSGDNREEIEKRILEYRQISRINSKLVDKMRSATNKKSKEKDSDDDDTDVVISDEEDFGGSVTKKKPAGRGRGRGRSTRARGAKRLS